MQKVSNYKLFQKWSETNYKLFQKWSETGIRKKFLFLPNNVIQNTLKLHTEDLDKTAIRQVKVEITEILHEKLSKTPSP